jgi:hypothetical protein
MSILITYPALPLVPAILYGLLYAHRRRVVVLVAALAWLAYVPYEYSLKLRILCSGECNIRVDLLLAYPVLLVLSVGALVAYALSLRPGAVIGGTQR